MFHFHKLSFRLLICILILLREKLLISGLDSAHYRNHLSLRHRQLPRLWSEWSFCSRTCGVGVKQRKRVCRERVSGHGAFLGNCSGDSVEYELCSRQACPPSTVEFLHHQCSQHNGQTISGREINDWIPYRYGPNHCELQCRAKERSLVHSFGKVKDGTHCPASDPRDPAICVNGRCTAIDCTGRLGSANKRDICGVCSGDNSTCVKIQNTFWGRKRQKLKESEGREDLQFDYNTIFSIPAGATDFLVSESSDTNFLVLMDHKGNYLLNGNRREQSSGRFLVEGSEFMYNRTADGSERLSSHGPIRHELMLLVLGSGDIPTIQHEYWIPQKSPAAKSRVYHPLNTIETKLPASQLSDNSISQTKMLPVTKFQGYKSYYHRNEILQSVPSWSIKRHKSFQQSFDGVFRIRSGNEKWRNETINRQPYIDIQQLPTVPPLILTTERLRNLHQQFSGLERPSRTSAFTRYSHFEKRKVRKNLLKQRHREKNMGTSRPQSRTEREESSHVKRKKPDNGKCLPCTRTKNQTRNFCKSDFVLQANIVASEKEQQTVRLELEVIRSYKNKVPILSREYIWKPDGCKCPKIKVGREYILMGRSGSLGRESRLFLDQDSFVRQFSQKRERTMLKLIRDQHSLCRKFDT